MKILNQERAPLSTHLEELRKTLFFAFVALIFGTFFCYLFYPTLINLFKSTLPHETKWVLLSPQEGFFVITKIIVGSGILLSAPAWLLCLGRFVLPALKEEELRLLPPFLLLSLIDIALGFYLAIAHTIPFLNRYLFEFNATLGVNEWRLSEYLDYVFMLCFTQIVLLLIASSLFMLVHINKIAWQTLASMRKYTILGSLILGAILTPPDVISQLAVALPMIGFYELAILYGRFLVNTSNVD